MTELLDLLGAGAVGTSPEDLAAHAHDWFPVALLRDRRGEPGQGPSAVVRPPDAAAVSTLLEWAQETGTPVVPFGGGSSVVRGIEPSGAVVIDLERLNAISEVDEKSRLVTAGAGVTGPELRAHLAERGYLLGHEPQSIDISTVGGWLATRACGQLSARYGGIEDLVAGLEAVLPGGRVVRTKTAPRRSTGPDLAGLMIGSEGALGIVTEATLRVSPLPTERADLCVRFEHMTEGVKACRLLAQSDLAPTMVRLYDPEDATLFLRNHPDEPPGPLLLTSFDGTDGVTRRDRAAGLMDGTTGPAALVAHWWEHRNDAVGEFRKVMAGEGLLGSHGIVDTIEVAGTWSVLRDLYHSLKDALSEVAMVVGCHLSHVYPDGACLYFTMASMCESDEQAEEVDARWWAVAMRTTLDSGGTISHHHGIGRARAGWIEEELGEWFEVLRQIKKAIDPKGIMNPGVMGL